MKQSVTSANTSINSKRLPAIYGKIRLNEGDRVLDYGCGRYTEHLTRHCLENHAELFPFDPFNIPEQVNRESREKLENRPATIGIMSNVITVCGNILTWMLVAITWKKAGLCNQSNYYTSLYRGVTPTSCHLVVV